MGKKIIGMTGLVVLISLAVFVYASTIDRDINLVKGWNLVPGFYHPNQMFGDDILPDNIKAVYILKQPDQEYVRVYPDQETDKLIGIDDDYYEKTSQWVYSDKSGPMEYFFEEPIPIEEFQIYRGWNFITLSQYLIEGEGTGLPDPTLDDVSGDCNIEKAFLYGNGQWVDFRSTYPEMDSTLLLKALVIKVTNDCRLGVSGSSVGPPGLPGGNEGDDINIGSNLDTLSCIDSDGTIETNTFNEGQTLEAEGLLITLLDVDPNSADLKIVDINNQGNNPIYIKISIGNYGDILINGINYKIQLISAIIDVSAIISVNSQRDYFESGEMKVSDNGDFSLTTFDKCALVSNYDSDGTPGGWQGVNSCSGENCYIQEAFCMVDSNGNVIDADATELYNCLKGCSNGACIQ